MAPQQYGDASVQYDDWVGTVACDDPHEGIEQVAEFARVPKGWDIVGMELAGGSEVDHSWAWILAVERQRIEDVGGIEQLAAATGGWSQALMRPLRIGAIHRLPARRPRACGMPATLRLVHARLGRRGYGRSPYAAPARAATGRAPLG